LNVLRRRYRLITLILFLISCPEPSARLSDATALLGLALVLLNGGLVMAQAL